MTAVDDIRAIQDLYPNVNVGISVQADFVTVSVYPLPTEVFPEHDSHDYPVGFTIASRVEDPYPGAFLNVFRYADKDVDAAVAAALAVVQGEEASRD
ncbi:hypothetical protein SAMN04488581_2661 [Mycolicibacterium neoaurum]|uniref:hypothetical protein n=1 Tax=Mycolicibacterium neoaurum TaxID=1795 RepID=UPI00055F87E6|nr:hypothetical protein [Mycolicibacterium neoaurum]SDD61151.1 hypothetical protein SAMN04488581_2661 [Mycolicibacterium neoaurum]